MPTYEIETASTDRRRYRVKADTLDEAISRVNNAHGEIDPVEEPRWGDEEIVSWREV